LEFGKKGKYLVFYFMMVNKRNLKSLLKVYDKFSRYPYNFFHANCQIQHIHPLQQLPPILLMF